MLELVLTAVAAARSRIVVGPPQSVPAGTRVVQEEPANSGPVASVSSGLVHVTAPVVAVVAADLPFLTAELVASLVAGLDGDPEADVALLVDERGRDQYLLGAWRTAGLRSALIELGVLPGRAMRDLVRAVRVIRIAAPAHGDAPSPWTDVDTPGDLDRARRQADTALSPENVRSGPAQK